MKKKEEKVNKYKDKVALPSSEEERLARVEAISKKLDKQFGSENTLMRMDGKNLKPVVCIPTGLAVFDHYVMQAGGIPRGRIVEIFGPESAGKTSFALHVLAEEQKLGGLGAFIDAEHALDPNYARKLGVNIEKLIFNQPMTGEQGLTVLEELIIARAITIAIVDSAAALTPQAELAGEMGDAHVGLQARMMAQALRKLSARASENDITVIFINQIREKIGVMFGNPETTPAGRALKHYSSVRIDVRRKDPITLSGAKEDKNILGHQIRLKAVKNKVGVPMREGTVDLFYEDGFNKLGSLVEYAKDINAVEISGAWIKTEWGGNYQGSDQLAVFLQENAKERKALEKKVAQLAAKINV